MQESLPQVNLSRQAKVYCEKIDKASALADHLPMAREKAILEPPLYVGEWIKALGMKQSEIAKKSGVKKSYLNLICHRKKDNPSLKILTAIANAMGLTIQHLQMPPPSSASIEKIRELPVDLIERIRRQAKAG